MGVVTRAARRRRGLVEEEEEGLVDHISRLPDHVLGNIVSLLPTRVGARTQVLPSRWRHLWSSAPLNVDLLTEPQRRALSAHPGPGRRFYIRYGDGDGCLSCYGNRITETLDGWLQSPALDGLQELEIHLWRWIIKPTAPLPASALRFSPTLRVAISGEWVFPDAQALQGPLLEQLTLSKVTVSETSLHTLLAGCHALESLLLHGVSGFSRLTIVSTTLRSIGVGPRWEDQVGLQQLLIQDAPCLERLLVTERTRMETDISVVSAPRLRILGELDANFYRLQFGTTALQGSTIARLAAAVPSVRILSLSNMKPCLDAAINLITCFPQLEKLYIEIAYDGEEDESYDNHDQKLISTLDIVRLRKIVLADFRDRKSHINFAKFFVMNASMLESMTLQLNRGSVGDDEWIRSQHMLVQIENWTSRGARSRTGSLSPARQVHDPSILDPFQRIHKKV
ncbi:hypothetical protein C2845_PM03G18470 [Panicum miliaceum]|uniref:Uncharacterized protein n=1 Tax=Panicum miliaceum TaxID=4540 RepID=A0A3L6T6C0_PANMI|nr:hypothetical protein C2845_PM03G18470 [Panicum miliaceum]